MASLSIKIFFIIFREGEKMDPEPVMAVVFHVAMHHRLFRERFLEAGDWRNYGQDFATAPDAVIESWKTADGKYCLFLVYPDVYPPNLNAIDQGASMVAAQNHGLHIVALDSLRSFPVAVYENLERIQTEISASIQIMERIDTAISEVDRFLEHAQSLRGHQQPRIHEEHREQQEEEEAERPRLMLFVQSLADFDALVKHIAIPLVGCERLSEDAVSRTLRIAINPGITCDDYIWCVCPTEQRHKQEAFDRARRWIAHNGEHAFCIVHDPAERDQDMADGQIRVYRSLLDAAMDVCVRLGLSGEATSRVATGVERDLERRQARPPQPQSNDAQRNPPWRNLVDFVGQHAARFEPPPPPPPPPFQEEEEAGVDLSGYDPDDRVAIEAILQQNARDGVPMVINFNFGGQQEVQRDPAQVARELVFDARFRADQAIRNAYDARRLGNAIRPPAQARPANMEQVRLAPPPPPPPAPAPAPSVAAAAPAGRVVGRQQNTRLRERVNARAAAARALEVVNNSADAKKLVQPRLEKSNDVTAVATTADENTCIICVDSHITTMLFPCLHYQFCSGCITAWKDNHNEDCPVCRAKIELVLQPRGKLTLDDLRARSDAPLPVAPEPAVVAPAPPPTVAVAAPAPEPSVEAPRTGKEPKAKRAKPAPKRQNRNPRNATSPPERKSKKKIGTRKLQSVL
jgi:hypothetical protein